MYFSVSSPGLMFIQTKKEDDFHFHDLSTYDRASEVPYEED